MAKVLPPKGFEGQVLSGSNEPRGFVDTTPLVIDAPPSGSVPVDRPQALSRWYVNVIEVADDEKSALVTEDNFGEIWAPLEIPNVPDGARVILDFRADGQLAVTAVIP